MWRFISLLFVFSNLSCLTHQPPAGAPPASAAEKLTSGPFKASSVEITARTELAPRRPQEIESTLLLDHAIQACLRPAIQQSDEHFSLNLVGYLNPAGGLEQFFAKTDIATLKDCVERAAPSLNFGRGRSGAFKTQILRPPPTGPGEKKVKSFLLDLNESKKLEAPGLTP